MRYLPNQARFSKNKSNSNNSNNLEIDARKET